MDIKQLQYFDEVVKTGKITTAANRLFISQQGLSMALGRLENELNCKLMKRTTDGMVLTEEGEYLAVHVKQLLAQFNEIEAHFQDTENGTSSVWVASAFGAMPEFLGRKIMEFREQNPNIRIELDEVDDNDCDDAVKSGRAELGLSVSPVDKKIFDVQEVFSSPFCIIVRKDNPMSELESISIHDLNDTPVMIMNSRSKTHLIFNQYCSLHNMTLNDYYLAGEVIAIHRLIADGGGVGITVKSVAESLNNPNVVAIPFSEKELTWRLNAIKRKNMTLSRSGKLFWDFLTEK